MITTGTLVPSDSGSAVPAAHASSHAAAGADPVTLSQSQITGLTAALAAKFANADVDTDTTLAANSDAKVPSQKAVKTFVESLVTGLLDLKGSLDASAEPNYSAASKGDCYVITVAGKVGGASGKTVAVGDFLIATADNAGGAEASVGTSWMVLESNLASITAAGLAMLQAADAAAQRTLLSLATTDRPLFASVHLGHAAASYASSYELDFDTVAFESLSLSGNVTFTTANLAAGRSKTVRVVADSSTRDLAFPGGWKFLGAAAPTSIAANKVGLLTITSFGTTDSDCLAAWAAES